MDRAEFLNRLEAQLLDVPQAEREEALQYYEDYLLKRRGRRRRFRYSAGTRHTGGGRGFYPERTAAG